MATSLPKFADRYVFFTREARAHQVAELRGERYTDWSPMGAVPGFCVAPLVPFANAASCNLPRRFVPELCRDLVVDHVLFHERQELHDPAIAVAALTGGPRRRRAVRRRAQRAVLTGIVPTPVAVVNASGAVEASGNALRVS